MRTTRPCTGAVLILCLLLAGPSARADSLEYACNLVARKLGTLAGARVTRAQETFVLDRKAYRGCVVRVEGESPCEPEAANSAWWALYPFTDVAPDDGWTALGDGWKVVREEDQRYEGPLFYHVARGNVFCLVQSRWAGGDAPHPSQTCESDVPTGKLRMVAQCALER